MIARLGQDLPRPRVVIVGEPTSMQVIDGHKCIDVFRTTVTGKEAHSSIPAIGVNAISAASKLVGRDRPHGGGDCENRKRSAFRSAALDGHGRHGGWRNRAQYRAAELRRPLAVARAAGHQGQGYLRAAGGIRETGPCCPICARSHPDAAVDTETETAVPAFSAATGIGGRVFGDEADRRKPNHAASPTPRKPAYFRMRAVRPWCAAPAASNKRTAADEYVSNAQIESCLEFLAKLTDLMSA